MIARALAALALALSCGLAGAHMKIGHQIDFEQKLGSQLPAQAAFVDEHGHAETLGAQFGKLPLVMQLGYLNCPDLCDTTLAGAVEALSRTGLRPDKDYRAVFASIDPSDTATLATKMKLRSVPAPQRAAWHFLTGKAPAIDALAQAAGFHYEYDDEHHQYAHPAGIVVLTPQGTVSRYFPGVRFDPVELRDALGAAQLGATGSLADRLLLVCYHFDPTTGKYTLAILNLLRAAIALFFVVAGFFVWRSLRRERS